MKYKVNDQLIFTKSMVNVTVKEVFDDGYIVEKENGKRLFATEEGLTYVERDDS